MQKITPIVVLICFTALLLCSCGKVSDPAAKAVEDYLTALVNKNANSLSALSCANWESNALLELDSLQAVSTKLENLSCGVTGSNGSTTQVICKGRIVATYNGEDQQFDLSVRTYQVVNQGGEYLVCGYQ